MIRKTTVVSLLFLPLVVLTGCPNKLPADGRQVSIERSYGGENYRGGVGGWNIKDGSLLLLRVPERSADGKEVLPQKAVVHERVLYLLWEDGKVEKFPEPQR